MTANVDGWRGFVRGCNIGGQQRSIDHNPDNLMRVITKRVGKPAKVFGVVDREPSKEENAMFGEEGVYFTSRGVIFDRFNSFVEGDRAGDSRRCAGLVDAVLGHRTQGQRDGSALRMGSSEDPLIRGWEGKGLE